MSQNSSASMSTLPADELSEIATELAQTYFIRFISLSL